MIISNKHFISFMSHIQNFLFYERTNTKLVCMGHTVPLDLKKFEI